MPLIEFAFPNLACFVRAKDQGSGKGIILAHVYRNKPKIIVIFSPMIFMRKLINVMELGMRQMRQRTFAGEFQVSGVALHSGLTCSVRLEPLPIGSGIRIVFPDCSEECLSVKIVRKTPLCTRLTSRTGASVDTVEHLFAALSLRGISNARLTFTDREVPILDGSAVVWLDHFEQVGIVEQTAWAAPLHVTSTYTYREGASEYKVVPGSFSLSVRIDFQNRHIGSQCTTVNLDELSLLAAARTFVLECEVASLRQQGLALGGSLDNALVIGDNGPLNSDGFRFENECVRHKALDFLGDMYVCGHRIIGKFDVVKPSHSSNAGFLSGLLKSDSLSSVLSRNAA